jgi:hypothetical protein
MDICPEVPPGCEGGDEDEAAPGDPEPPDALEEARQALVRAHQGLKERLAQLKLQEREASRIVTEQGGGMPPGLRLALQSLEEALDKAGALLGGSAVVDTGSRHLDSRRRRPRGLSHT